LVLTWRVWECWNAGALLNALGVIGPGPNGYPPWQAWPDCSSGVCPIFIHPNASSVRTSHSICPDYLANCHYYLNI
jgi:hypothetical protein